METTKKDLLWCNLNILIVKPNILSGFKECESKSSLSQEVFRSELDIPLVEMLQIQDQDSMGIKVSALKVPSNFEILRLGLCPVMLQDILCITSHGGFFCVNFSRLLAPSSKAFPLYP